MDNRIENHLLPELTEAEVLEKRLAVVYPEFDDPEQYDWDGGPIEREEKHRELVSLRTGRQSLSLQEFTELFQSYKETGDIEIRNKLVVHNLGLVSYVVNNVCKRWVGRVRYEDLFQEGVMGVIKALDRFNPTRGVKFSTYATYWIYQYMNRLGADTGYDIRRPIYLHDTLEKIRKTEFSLSCNGHGVSAEEVAVETGLPVPRVKKLLAVRRLTEDTVPITVEQAAEDEDKISSCPYSSLSAQSVEAGLELDEALYKMEQMKIVLAQRFKPNAVKMYLTKYGLSDGSYEFRTLKEAAKPFGLSPERARQVQRIGDRKLRRICSDVESFTKRLRVLSELCPWRPAPSFEKLRTVSAQRPKSRGNEKTIPVAPEKLPDIGSIIRALGKLAKIDREVFMLHYGVGKTSGPIVLSFTASQFGISETNVQRILERVWQKLPSLGCDLTQSELLRFLALRI